MTQAQNAIAAPTSRRNFIKSGTAVMAAFAVPAIAAAKANGTAAPFVDREFATKRRKFRELKTALDNLYKANDLKLERLERPDLPGALLEPLEIPGIGKKTPDENG